ncbi:hypothetical protein [Curtobacterium sp. ISL-83]|uniref:hypothetical protein n=1 Tax=Curtobacterium sp. ISL-83 TaxID=2819145 RepID=UPI001BE67AFD|nr:hypothetical protein [Curtobacterium sp. ISL-83]MBT2502969.1 hypothetical protein [Curtobacterium sp. ISL-83]
MGFSVGHSSLGELAGVEQFVSTPMVAEQVSSLAYEFDTQYPGARARGDRLTVNEGIRSRARMRMLRAAWEQYQRNGTPWAALAAALYYSTHREEIGTALDFGITQKDGTNRAMTPDEAAWVHARGERRGIVWTGRLFNPQEQWHHNGGYAYSVAPITGVNRPGARLFTDKTPAKPAPIRRDPDDMQVQWNDKHTKALILAGGKHTVIDKTTPDKNDVDWLGQVKLCERVARTNPADSYAGGMNDSQHAVVRAILRSMEG